MIEGLVDVQRELQRLHKKYSVLCEDAEKIQKRFEKPDFLDKAPQEVIEKDQARLEKLLSEAQRLE